MQNSKPDHSLVVNAKYSKCRANQITPRIDGIVQEEDKVQIKVRRANQVTYQ